MSLTFSVTFLDFLDLKHAECRLNRFKRPAAVIKQTIVHVIFFVSDKKILFHLLYFVFFFIYISFLTKMPTQVFVDNVKWRIFIALWTSVRHALRKM